MWSLRFVICAHPIHIPSMLTLRASEKRTCTYRISLGDSAGVAFAICIMHVPHTSLQSAHELCGVSFFLGILKMCKPSKSTYAFVRPSICYAQTTRTHFASFAAAPSLSQMSQMCANNLCWTSACMNIVCELLMNEWAHGMALCMQSVCLCTTFVLASGRACDIAYLCLCMRVQSTCGGCFCANVQSLY